MRSGLAKVLVVLILCIAAGVAASADELHLSDDSVLAGTITRIVIGESIEFLMEDPETGAIRVETHPLHTVQEVVVVDVEEVAATLTLRTGDRFRGMLTGSPLASQIEFKGESGTTYLFDASEVREVRMDLRAAAPTAPDAKPEDLLPAFGLGLSLASGAVGVTRDAIAYFSEDWMLIAALGLHFTWSGEPVVGIGVSSDLTYLRKLGKAHVGVGTGVFFDMSEVEWRPTINVRVLIPFTWKDWQTTLSVGFRFRAQSY
ncbi:MAG: hypothetical protein WBC63_06715 [Candidatus Bipolaricaulia bacterium]